MNGEPEVNENCGKTIGEELFLVHLSRKKSDTVDENDDDDDVDHEVFRRTKEPEMSPGEELWHIHCKRAEGHLDEDYPSKKLCNEKSKTLPQKAHKTRLDDRVIRLRNREIKVMED
jgi:hypothetical protein